MRTGAGLTARERAFRDAVSAASRVADLYDHEQSIEAVEVAMDDLWQKLDTWRRS